MERKINSIKVLKNKYSTTVYVNFDNGTFGTRSHDNGKWYTSGLTADELSEAKKLAVHDGKWANWKAPRQETQPARLARINSDNEEDAVFELNENSKWIAQHPGEGDQYGDQDENVVRRGL